MAENQVNQIVKTAAAAKSESKVTIEEAIIKQVSSPSTLQRVATDKGINPQEVFVRVTFEYEENQFAVSNKLKFLTKAGYIELIEAQKTGKAMKLTVDTENGFFYIEHDVSVDDLFKEELPKAADNRANLALLVK